MPELKTQPYSARVTADRRGIPQPGRPSLRKIEVGRGQRQCRGQASRDFEREARTRQCPEGAAVPVPAAPPQPGLALVNINTASANDMVLFLGLTKEVAERVATNRPYRLKGELVAKDVLPKATFDVIKDRITVSP